MGGGDEWERRHWGLWSSRWRHEPCEGVPTWVAKTHGDVTNVVLGGAPWGATNRARGAAGTHGKVPAGAS
eukprot:974909-Pyramimonas_sp.AAC.1